MPTSSLVLIQGLFTLDNAPASTGPPNVGEHRAGAFEEYGKALGVNNYEWVDGRREGVANRLLRLARPSRLELATRGADLALVDVDQSALETVQAAVEATGRKASVHLVDVSSSAGLTGMKEQSSYASTKFAIRGLSECLYVELANSSVGITCVHPGAVATNILANARMEPSHKGKMLKIFHLAMPPEKAARLIVKAIEKNRFKLVFCVESRILDCMKRLFPTGTLKLMRMANRPGATG